MLLWYPRSTNDGTAAFLYQQRLVSALDSHDQGILRTVDYYYDAVVESYCC